MPAGINIAQMRNELKRQLPGPRLKGQAWKLGVDSFRDAKGEWLTEDFDEHRVTKELNDGNTAVHTMGILTKGNLFSLLGFEENATPAQDLRGFLQENIRIQNQPSIEVKTDRFSYDFPVIIPNKEEIEQNFPLDWNSGRSWIAELEEGITGLSFYIFKLFFGHGRSKTGLQSKNKVRSQPKAAGVPYLKEILKQLEGRLK